MFGQWLLLFCSLLFVSSPAIPATATICAEQTELRDVSRCVSADVQYGWQVSGGAVSAYEVGAK